MSDDNFSSELGTKEYWKEFYEKELENFQDHGDVGEIWFGESSVKRIMKWLASSGIPKAAPILDVGCGNGMILIHLAKSGFEDLTGIDYVEEAVRLAASIAKEENFEIQYEAVDFLQELSTLPPSSHLHRKYKVVLDKGTYDAVGLCPNDGRSKRLKYVHQMNSILDVDGVLILTSCNWTKEELLQVFEGFQVVDEISAPAFNFGGKTGSTVTTLVMKRK